MLIFIGIYSVIFILIILIIDSFVKNGDLSNLLNAFKISNIDNKLKLYGLLILSYIIYYIS